MRSNGISARSATLRTSSAAPSNRQREDLVLTQEDRPEVPHRVCGELGDRPVDPPVEHCKVAVVEVGPVALRDEALTIRLHRSRP